VTKESAVGAFKMKLEEIPSLRGLNSDAPAFMKWERSAKSTIRTVYGEASAEYTDFNQTHFISYNMYSTEAEDAKAYEHGLDAATAQIEAHIENLSLFGLPSHSKGKGTSTPSRSVQGGLTQHIHLSQTQVQQLRNEVDLSGYDSETQAQANELLSELSKGKTQDKTKIAAIVKWLADKSVDILIAYMSRPR